MHLYFIGRKVDSWMAVDAETGRKHQVFGFGQEDFNMCPADSTRTIYIGRTGKLKYAKRCICIKIMFILHIES
jgi:hypothetical protein